ncbi:methyltransferase TYW3-domain-containing protein [Mortierella sp. GBAus27b]|nr:hypothetical protein BGX31_011417 [Mortierella sp. GBA43]KAI8355440.1 methyltransferase TYW3-domain-containing protein [Mortierella sp. GBAus27b]
MSDGFASRKKRILAALNTHTPDKSPKGYVDEPLLPLIMLINKNESFVTTSSCSGRICTYLEGIEESQAVEDDDRDDLSKQIDNVAEDEEDLSSLQAAVAEKRAKGGQWLYVSHEPMVLPIDKGLSNRRWVIDTLFGTEARRVVSMEENCMDDIQDMTRLQLVYFKFEPMILHVDASTQESAKSFLNHSLHSGYRNSGILPSPKRTMLAVRSTLKLDVPIAYVSTTPVSATEPKIYLMVSLAYLISLIELGNDKFRRNFAQIHRFEERLTVYLEGNQEHLRKKMGDQGEWEDRDTRKERKRKEGLLRQQMVAKAKAETETKEAEAEVEIGIPQDL